jgi:hypothetical protein
MENQEPINYTSLASRCNEYAESIVKRLVKVNDNERLIHDPIIDERQLNNQVVVLNGMTYGNHNDDIPVDMEIDYGPDFESLHKCLAPCMALCTSDIPTTEYAIAGGFPASIGHFKMRSSGGPYDPVLSAKIFDDILSCCPEKDIDIFVRNEKTMVKVIKTLSQRWAQESPRDERRIEILTTKPYTYGEDMDLGIITTPYEIYDNFFQTVWPPRRKNTTGYLQEIVSHLPVPRSGCRFPKTTLMILVALTGAGRLANRRVLINLIVMPLPNHIHMDQVIGLFDNSSCMVAIDKELWLQHKMRVMEQYQPFLAALPNYGGLKCSIGVYHKNLIDDLGARGVHLAEPFVDEDVSTSSSDTFDDIESIRDSGFVMPPLKYTQLSFRDISNSCRPDSPSAPVISIIDTAWATALSEMDIPIEFMENQESCIQLMNDDKWRKALFHDVRVILERIQKYTRRYGNLGLYSWEAVKLVPTSGDDVGDLVSDTVLMDDLRDEIYLPDSYLIVGSQPAIE